MLLSPPTMRATIPKKRPIVRYSSDTTLLSFFPAVYLGSRAKREILAFPVLQATKRIFGIPDFRYYGPCLQHQRGAFQNSKGDPGRQNDILLGSLPVPPIWHLDF